MPLIEKKLTLLKLLLNEIIFDAYKSRYFFRFPSVQIKAGFKLLVGDSSHSKKKVRIVLYLSMQYYLVEYHEVPKMIIIGFLIKFNLFYIGTT